MIGIWIERLRATRKSHAIYDFMTLWAQIDNCNFHSRIQVIQVQFDFLLFFSSHFSFIFSEMNTQCICQHFNKTVLVQ